MNPLRISATLIALILLAGGASTASAQITVRSSLSDDREVTPGERYTGQIMVANETDQYQQAKIYQSDYAFFHDGTNDYGEPGSSPRSNATWIRFNPPLVNVPPNQTMRISYEVNVPDSIDGGPPEGSYWSLIMIENMPDLSDEALIDSTGKPRYSVRQIMRYGIQVATHIRGTGSADLAFVGSQLVREESGVSLYVNVQNNGSRLVRPDVWVEPFSSDGVSFGRLDGVKNRIYPGTSVRQRFQLGDLNEGSYRALVVLDAGGEEVFGAEYSLQVE